MRDKLNQFVETAGTTTRSNNGGTQAAKYVVWKGINDTEEHALALAKFCKNVPSKVNLIEYNPIDDGEFQQASENAIALYQRILEQHGTQSFVRRSRGKDIDAACGQLANKS